MKKFDVFLTVDPMGNAFGWLQGQLQSVFLIGILVAGAYLLFKKQTSQLLMLIGVGIVSAMFIYQPQLVGNFFQRIGEIFMR